MKLFVQKRPIEYYYTVSRESYANAVECDASKPAEERLIEIQTEEGHAIGEISSQWRSDQILLHDKFMSGKFT